ncbi:Putative membrane protein [Bacillus toyonensis]|uniref:hypothetical protein n=1 Tax=Bacillus TaxID=1386 RepID=UPI0001A0B4AF|nr:MULTISPECIES: hypothetical protein [Bacillus cereus group]EEL31236.1 hypothetical protein bcere0019_56010 [Bacillus cereus Rock3-28]EEL37274.1 hypothetical protein bcere0020_53370 [Bacillus cereus Rock3-29]KAB0449429.1 hypothetical protein CH334_04510 [Lysinibacillus sp. VIA-II-2016]EJV90185.1 hypothetical protein IGI_05445 [Bacillus toyonensis]EOP46226.1 hypothetical protein IKI_05180 [Bacillus toyonensis]
MEKEETNNIENKGKLGFILFLVIVPTLLIASIINYIHVINIEGTVIDKYSKKSGKSDKFYIVIQQNDDTEKVITNTDGILMMKFNSADIQAEIKKGEKYNFTLRGYRIPFLSLFPNIDNAKKA